MKEEREQVLTEAQGSEYKILRTMQLSESRRIPHTDPQDDDDTPPRHSNQTINSTSNDVVQFRDLNIVERDEG